MAKFIATTSGVAEVYASATVYANDATEASRILKKHLSVWFTKSKSLDIEVRNDNYSPVYYSVKFEATDISLTLSVQSNLPYSDQVIRAKFRSFLSRMFRTQNIIGNVSSLDYSLLGFNIEEVYGFGILNEGQLINIQPVSIPLGCVFTMASQVQEEDAIDSLNQPPDVP